ncbi:cytochrome P450 monooxygenase-like protein [Hypoxylon trugodes]|uniref:cytochrome P450 monooxygenase-like protein n=1 Tax=Hypoxylon trugodes TaxID=326681 RepID=UPI0021964AF0|nr:cytochrome P450 monooxygenase-like protein [Hypoxylon trugodes]KAI1383021.1 cytochrome P450 monooxygenase-like protein [Hypoxylon trugodes]
MDALLLLGVIAGVLAHNVIFIRGEWHMRISSILNGHLLVGFLVTYFTYQTIGDRNVGETLTIFAAATASYLTALFGSMIVYRLFFHQLSKFPGPRLAAVSKFWHIFNIRTSRNYLFLRRMHEKYGSYVRTGPNEVTLFDPGVFQLLDGWGNTTTKDIWYDIMQPRSSAIFTRDENMHREGRKVWVQSLSTKAMDSFNPRIAELTHSLSRCIASYGSEAVEVGEVMSWFSFDAMGEVVFGQHFNLLQSKKWITAIRDRDGALSLVGLIGDASWIAHLAFLIVPFYGRVKNWFDMVSFCEDQMKLRHKNGRFEDKLDMAEFFIEEHDALKTKMSLEDRDNYLGGTAVTAVVAGSDTTRAALVGVCWFLAKYPDHANKILAEIANVDVDNADILATLPHLNAFVNETLRLLPPAMTGTARQTGPNGLLFNDVLIPPHTKVTAPRYVIMRMESAFPQPDEFIPERWYSRPELIRDRRAFSPFSAGSRQCVGRSVAYSELRLVVAILLKDYHIEFAPGYDPMTMWRDMKDQVTAQPGDVMCLFKPREK